MSRDCCVALPLSAESLSEFVIMVFPDHTHYFSMHWVAVAADNDICINIFTITAHVPVDI